MSECVCVCVGVIGFNEEIKEEEKEEEHRKGELK